MRENPVFEIRGRSFLTAIGYMFIGILLIVATYCIFYYHIFGSAEFEIIIFPIILIVPVTILCFFAAYNALLFKTVRIDGNHFYFLKGNKLKKKIALQDIESVRIGPFAFYSLLSFKFISIGYIENGKSKTFHISEDLFPFRELQIIFGEFTPYAQSHNIMMVPH